MFRRTCTLLTSVALAVAMLAAPASADPATYEQADEYPDAPSADVEAAPAPLVEAGAQEDANWVPFLGNHELWCTNGNPGYAGCAGHHGYPAIDIGMPVGTNIYASGPGTIRTAGSAGDARGTYIEIQHTDGVRSRYYHLSAELVNVGQLVERGTLIGRSGMTGQTTSPHLHYEERTSGGTLKDPGVMFGIVNGQLVAYPDVSGHTSWWDTPYGTRIRNRDFAVDNTSLYWGGPGVATGDLNGDGFDDVVTGIPGEDSRRPDEGPNTLDSGAAFVLYGGETGVTNAGADRIFQGYNQIPGTMENNEVFGAAVAVGDFDGDEFDDVAVGAPAATVDGHRGAGEVVVLYGSAEGLLPATAVLLEGLARENADLFGASLVTGDFDGDGDDELVVGAPGEAIAGRPVAGAVTVFDGSPDGLGPTPREIAAHTADVAGSPEAGDRLGVSVAAGDVNGDDRDDLAVGIPGEDTPGIGAGPTPDAGAVLVLLGRPTGLRGAGSVELAADTPVVAGDGRPMDQLGTTVAVGDVHGDGFADVAVGAIGRDVGGALDAGVVLVLKGSEAGVRPAGSRQITADTEGVAGVAQAGDRLASGLALGDLDGDGAADLLAGIAGQRIDGATRAGAVLVVHGGEAGLSGVGSQQLHAGTPTTGLVDKAEEADVLGASVAIGDLDANSFGDLVIGVPGEDLPGAVDGGSLTLVLGADPGLRVATSKLFHGGNSGPMSRAERGDRWGGLYPIYLR